MNDVAQQRAGDQQQAQEQGGGFRFWKIIGMFFLVQWIMGFFQKSGNPQQAYINVLHYNNHFNLTISNNVTNQTFSEYDLLYSTDSVYLQNFSFTGEELLQHPYFEVSVSNSDFEEHAEFPLTKYMKIQKVETKNLLFDKHDEYQIKQSKGDDNQSKYEWHVKDKQYILFVHDSNTFTRGAIPPQVKYKFSADTNGMSYVPNLDVDNFFLRRKDHRIILANETYDIPIEFSCYYSWKYYMTDSVKQSGKFYENMGLDIMDETQEDNMKEMLFETNYYLLGITMIVSVLHSIFSMLAIKNDYQYWKNLDSQEGISIRSLYVNFGFDIVITLYLLDNDTSYIIIVQQFIELGLMAWKITKTTKFKRIPNFPFVDFLHKESYQSQTQQFDQKAASFLWKLTIPLMVCYAIYSLIYHEHKGVYSFIIETLVECIYLFGFINMTPQLFINYKLKSVAHLPWKAMTYKFLNTIIDDLFAFIITMPWLKRLSCFRDDVIFLIYIYQRRIYRVDPNRKEGIDGSTVQDGKETISGEIEQNSNSNKTAVNDKKKKLE